MHGRFWVFKITVNQNAATLKKYFPIIVESVRVGTGLTHQVQSMVEMKTKG